MNRCLVIGAGTAGATVAHGLALRGVDVLLVDRRTRPNVGASWVNGVEADLFDELELGRPPDDVVWHHGGRFIMSNALGDYRKSVEEPPQQEIDMRALNAWLLELAEDAGAELRFRTRAEVLEAVDGGRLVSLQGGSPEAFDCVIDASGYRSDPLPSDLQDQTPLTPAFDLCSAFQGVYEIIDPDAASAWLDELGLEPGDTLSRSGIEGGFSILNSSVSPDLTTMAVLTGTMHRPAYRTGGRLAASFVNRLSFVRKRRFGGGGLIPLAPLAAQFTSDAYLAIGGRSGQIFGQHGSGVATGMRSGAIAANAVAAAMQLGDTSVHGLWDYNVAWQRGPGAVCAFYQPLRWLSSSLSPSEADTLLRADIINADSIADALALRLPRANVGGLLRVAAHLPELITMIPRLAHALQLGTQLHAHMRAFPARGPRGEYESWRRRYAALMEKGQALAISGNGDGSLPERTSRNGAG